MALDIAPPSCKSGARSNTLKLLRSSVVREMTRDHFSDILGLPLYLLAPLLMESSRLYLSISGSTSSSQSLESLCGGASRYYFRIFTL
jgi:hypothetical protein